MRRKYNLTHLILASVIALGLTPLMVGAAPQAKIAFASDRDGNFEIYVMDIDGRNPRRLTNNGFSNTNPSWSPDGKHIAFVSEREGNFVGKRSYIYVMDANGKNQRKLTRNPFDEGHPSWSPDGKHIAFTGRPNVRTHKRIYAVDTEGKNLRRLTLLDHEGWHPSWSPDSQRIAFNGWGHEILVMDADGSNQQRLTENPGIDWYPSWAPDGKRIAFVSHRDGNYEIYAMNPDGARQVRRLTKDGSEDTDPAWFDPSFAVEVVPFAVGPNGKKFTIWGWLKQVAR